MGINASTIQKLYIAYFNRPADVAGLQYWEGQLDANKISLPSLAQSFSEQSEYKLMYGGKTTADVVTALYKNLFGRTVDAAGLKYWSTQIDSGAVNLGTAALAIVNGATPQSLDGATIDSKLAFAAGFTASLDTAAKAASYSSAYTFEVMRNILSTVSATALLPTLVPTQPLKIAEASNGISAAEKFAGMDVIVDLTGMQAAAGFQMELMNGNNSFSTPITHVLTLDEVLARKAVIHIPGNAYWGNDGTKTLGVKVSDIFGNTGKTGAQTAVLLDSTPPMLPPSGTYTTAWSNVPGSGVVPVMSSFQYNILAGENTGGSATLVLNGIVIGKVTNIGASATTLNFQVDPAFARQAYNDYFTSTSSSLSLQLTDAAGNTNSTMLKDFKIHPVYADKPGTPATNISIYTSSSGTLAVKANINSLEYFTGTAYLKINGQVIAADNLILQSDGTVDFNVFAVTSAQVQNLINNGGVVSVAVVDFNGNAIESTNNPTLQANQYGSRAYIDSYALPPVLPKVGTYITAYLNQPTYNFVMSEIKYTIVAGQNTGGSAILMEGNNVLARIGNIGANDTVLDFVFDNKTAKQVYDDYFTNHNLSLVITNTSGYSISTKLWDFQMRAIYTNKDGTPASNIVLTPVGGTTTAINTINSSNTNLLVKASINGWEYSFTKAYLKINGQIVAVDDTISPLDSTVDFNLGTTDSAQLQNMVKNGGIVSVIMVDMNGKFIESTNNPYLTTTVSSSSTTHDTKLDVVGVAHIVDDTYSQMVSGPAPVPLELLGQSQHHTQYMDFPS
ncbi:DUF4214 domain-containing protein [Undibacterium sp. CY18W]|uniref:DUF4214 domain-containing protein n=1 Tax=Undibacterium hunanense TaxID=2762292 RepID=A0ABR6ZZ10_9BURK|nr:DUF4214 domain-containing protein [Undibacterium hunanense]MBC3920894.1 DUF4214 domain-containing protein [Undibacterium hunanense]